MKYINVNLCSGIDIGRLAWDNATYQKLSGIALSWTSMPMPWVGFTILI